MISFNIFLFMCVTFNADLILAEKKCAYSRTQLVPTNIYDNLKCVPKYRNDYCLEEYTDCPHTKRPPDTCHFKGKTYNIGDTIDSDATQDIWGSYCKCKSESVFQCPQLTDGCAEDWVGGYPAPGCYIRRELNHYCGAGQICPPFDEDSKCIVNGVKHRVGDVFSHPSKPCTQCVCDKGFDDRLEAPFCQPVNCTQSLLDNSQQIDNFCAPFYSNPGSDCCPSKWICPKETDQHYPNPIPSPKDNSNLKCQFGEKIIALGDYLHQQDTDSGTITCECIVPPYLYCRVFPKDDRVYD